jgi:hypothetical protein
MTGRERGRLHLRVRRRGGGAGGADDDVDAARPKLGPQALSEADGESLGARVRRAVRSADEPRHRRHQHHPAPLALHHLPREVMREQERRAHVDGHRALDVAGLELDEARNQRERGAADEQPHLPTLDRSLDLVDEILRREIEADGVHLHRRELAGERIERLLAAGEQHEVHAALREGAGERGADALRGSRDQRPGAVALGEAHFGFGASARRRISLSHVTAFLRWVERVKTAGTEPPTSVKTL